MKPRLKAILVHGMGHDHSWWSPLLACLRDLDIEPLAIDMPSLESDGPGAWVDAVVCHMNGNPAFLIGHSLGAAVCVRAALLRQVEGIVLLACPLFSDDFFPPVPDQPILSTRAIARVTTFLRQTSDVASRQSRETVHFIGERDPFIPVVQARRFPFQTMVIPSAGHELNRAPGLAPAVIEHIVASSYGRKHLDPGTRARHTTASSMASLGLTVAAPAPARLDVEITTRCPLECPLCARTLFRQIPHHPDMEPSVFEKLLTQMEHLKEIFFVGLGEPLLHPRLDAFIERATARSIPSRLVTNGLLASPGVLARLRDKGLSEVTFSIDSVDPARFRALKGGARLDVVLEHFRSVPADMAKSVFVTLSQDNVDDLAGLVDLVAEAGLRALAVSDANFAPNASRSLHASPSTRQLADAIRHAREKNILLVSPHFHDLDRTFDSYRQCRVRKPADLSSRYDRHTHCLAPWRIAVISANGDMTPCNCSPMTVVGNVARGSCGDIWNGERMQEWRWNVMSGSCRDCCDCPRY